MKYIFGGAFDPISRGHMAIIKAIHKHLQANDEFYVLVSNNDEKLYKSTLDERFDVVNRTLKSAFQQAAPTVMIQDKRTYRFLNEQFYGQADEIVIVVGEDEWHSLLDGRWQNHEALLENYKFIVARRAPFTGEMLVHKNKIRELNIEDCMDISSSKVREIFYRNPATIYTDVKEHIHKSTFEAIKDLGMYCQNGENYANEEAEFLADYAIRKKENNWGEPSVTADIVGYNGDEVLLIRRLKPPYKNYWALPGGFFNAVDSVDPRTKIIVPKDPDIDYAAQREFYEETNIDIPVEKFRQIKTYAHMFDPRMRIVDVAFSVRVSAHDKDKAIGCDDAAEAKWFKINELPKLAFHHDLIINDWKKQMEKDGE